MLPRVPALLVAIVVTVPLASATATTVAMTAPEAPAPGSASGGSDPDVSALPRVAPEPHVTVAPVVAAAEQAAPEVPDACAAATVAGAGVVRATAGAVDVPHADTPAASSAGSARGADVVRMEGPGDADADAVDVDTDVSAPAAGMAAAEDAEAAALACAGTVEARVADTAASKRRDVAVAARPTVDMGARTASVSPTVPEPRVPEIGEDESRGMQLPEPDLDVPSLPRAELGRAPHAAAPDAAWRMAFVHAHAPLERDAPAAAAPAPVPHAPLPPGAASGPAPAPRGDDADPRTAQVASAGARDAGAADGVAVILARAAGVAAAILVPALAAWLLYHRIRGPATLKSPVRRAILAHLDQTPGAGVRELAAAAGVTYTTACYHLKRLEDEDFVVRGSANGTLRYYRNGTLNAEARAVHQLLASEGAMRVLAHVRRHPRTYRAAVADALGLSVTAVNWHLKRLIATGLVRERRVGRKALLEADVTRLEEARRRVPA